MRRMTLTQLEAAIGCHWLATRGSVDGDIALGNIVHDSREVEPGDVFWAMRGKSHDGATFAAHAYERGASAVVTSCERVTPPAGRAAIVVRDAEAALWQAADWVRNRFRGTIVAVTGSVGKTTTRAMIHHLLGAKLRGTSSTRNFNNHLGLPLSILAWDRDDEYAVVELGASAPGEIARLAALCRPHVGVITRIAEAHLGGFGSREALADAKAELLDALPSDGVAVLNGDDSAVLRAARHTLAPTLWFGRSADCQVVASNVRYEQGRLSFVVEGRNFSAYVWGRHHLPAALAAVSVARHMRVAWDEISDRFPLFEPAPMRCEVRSVAGATVINDAYNASPAAVRAALELVRDFAAVGRRIVVLGDMAELGDEAERLHRQIGDEVVSRSGADLLFACGRHASAVIEGARHAGMPSEKAFAYRDAADMTGDLQHMLARHDVILVKGARAMHMERLVDELGHRMPADRAGAINRIGDSEPM